MKTLTLTEPLYDYMLRHAPDVNPVLPRLREETRKLPGAMMQIAPEQGAFMHLLARLIGAKRILEVGCFTGYSAICMGQALPDKGRLITLDVNPDTGAIARRYFAEAGLADKVELRLGPAQEALGALRQEFGPESFDLMFIDADKGNMHNYYEQGLRLIRPGGLILADNVLWSGAVADPKDDRPDTVAIRQFNEKLRTDNRVDRVMLNVADGLYILRRK